MTSNWSPSLDRGHSSNMVGLDIEGAFDGVWHRARRAAGTDDILLVLLKNYLSERVLMNSKKSTHSVLTGAPRDSILGPHLFLSDQAFADDLSFCKLQQPK